VVLEGLVVEITEENDLVRVLGVADVFGELFGGVGFGRLDFGGVAVVAQHFAICAAHVETGRSGCWTCAGFELFDTMEDVSSLF
jgi:hypothetical protein